MHIEQFNFLTKRLMPGVQLDDGKFEVTKVKIKGLEPPFLFYYKDSLAIWKTILKEEYEIHLAPFAEFLRFYKNNFNEMFYIKYSHQDKNSNGLLYFETINPKEYQKVTFEDLVSDVFIRNLFIAELETIETIINETQKNDYIISPINHDTKDTLFIKDNQLMNVDVGALRVVSPEEFFMLYCIFEYDFDTNSGKMLLLCDVTETQIQTALEYNLNHYYNPEEYTISIFDKNGHLKTKVTND